MVRARRRWASKSRPEVGPPQDTKINRHMQLSVTGRQLDVGDSWRRHVEDQLPELVEKYFDNAQEAQVTLSRNGAGFQVDLVVHVGKRILLQSKGAAGDAYPAFEEAAEHLGKRLRRYKRRLRDHHRSRPDVLETWPAQQYVLAGEQAEAGEPDQPIVIAEIETEIETLSVGEAVMRMDLSNLSAMLFRNKAHGGLNMVYHRDDGHIGWVDPRGNRIPDSNGSDDTRVS